LLKGKHGITSFLYEPISIKLKGFIFLLKGLFAFIFLKWLRIEGLDMVI